MKVLVAAGVALMLGASQAGATGADAPQPPKPLALSLPTSLEQCLTTLTLVLDHAEAADLLDDQIDEAEEHLAKLETACHDSRFEDALAEARAIEKLVAMNK